VNTIRLVVDAVVDQTGACGREIWVTDGCASLEPPVDAGPVETIHRPGFVVPGLRDAHLHLGSITAATSGVTLKGARDLDAVSQRITGSGSGDIVAIAFDETEMAPSRLMDADDLDSMIDDRAVLVYRVCGHIAMANSVALDRAGVDRSTPDPAGGSFDRDAAGEPTGVLRETAIDLVAAVIDDAARAFGDDELVSTIDRLSALGLTSITAMIPAGAPAWCGPDDELDRLLAMRGGPQMPVDAVLISNTVGDLVHHASRLESGNLRFAGWKGFADGSLGGHTAALSTPYRDRPGESGTVRYDADHFHAMADAALELGGSVHIHAIGDLTVASVLDLFGELISSGAQPDRLRVEHASVLTPDLIAGMSDLGIIASVQPAFVRSDARWLDARLGPERARWAYPFRSMLDAGVRLVGGSDAPVEHPDPLAGIRAAIDRSGWNLEESLDPWEAVSLFADGVFDSGAALWISPGADRFERIA
jgi:predicted amidohydrolase YtcJ